MVIVRMRVVHVTIMVAVLGVVIMIVGVVVHPVHPLHFTRLRQFALASRPDFPGCLLRMQSAETTTRIVHRKPETAKEHRQECLCYQWEV